MLKTIAGHTSARGICRYLTHKNRALASDYINIDVPEGSREFDWAETMDTTRRSFGNDLPWRGKRVRTYKHYVVSPDPKDGIALEALRDLATSWAQEHFSEYTPHSERPHDAEPERHGAGPSAARGRLGRPRADPHRPGGGRGAPRGLSVGSRRLPDQARRPERARLARARPPAPCGHGRPGQAHRGGDRARPGPNDRRAGRGQDGPAPEGVPALVQAALEPPGAPTRGCSSSTRYGDGTPRARRRP